MAGGGIGLYGCTFKSYGTTMSQLPGFCSDCKRPFDMRSTENP